MRGIGLAVMVLLQGVQAVAFEPVHVVYFASEPVTVRMDRECAPEVRFQGELYRSVWDVQQSREGYTWSTELPADAPLGIWQVCAPGGACVSILRVADDRALLKVEAELGAEISVGGQVRLTDALGRAWFVLAPGSYRAAAWVPAKTDPMERQVDLRQGKRTLLSLVALSADASSTHALPGSTVTLTAGVIFPGAILPQLSLTAPDGWTIERLPISAARRGCWSVVVPEGFLGTGVFEVKAPELGLEARAELTVRPWLPPEVVIAHWDLERDELDLASPGAITYERLLWASAWIGHELPHTGRTLARAEVEELARSWADDEERATRP